VAQHYQTNVTRKGESMTVETIIVEINISLALLHHCTWSLSLQIIIQIYKNCIDRMENTYLQIFHSFVQFGVPKVNGAVLRLKSIKMGPDPQSAEERK
jgi:hypothetical protein